MSAVAPWLSCCSSCADRARQAGALPTGAATAPAAPAGGLSTGTGALLVLGGIFLVVVYGEKWLGKRGG